MTTAEYRQDDQLGVGYCPRCHRTITIDTALCGYCTVHGKVPADFARPLGWADPDEKETDMAALVNAYFRDVRDHARGATQTLASDD